MATKKKIAQSPDPGVDQVQAEEDIVPPPRRAPAKATLPEAPKTRPGFVLCLVTGSGQVVANGFKDGQPKNLFQAGDRAEFTEEDVESLPEILLPVA